MRFPRLSKAGLETIGKSFIHIGEAAIIASIVALILASDRKVAWWQSLIGIAFGILLVGVGIFYIERAEKRGTSETQKGRERSS